MYCMWARGGQLKLSWCWLSGAMPNTHVLKKEASFQKKGEEKDFFKKITERDIQICFCHKRRHIEIEILYIFCLPFFISTLVRQIDTHVTRNTHNSLDPTINTTAVRLMVLSPRHC